MSIASELNALNGYILGAYDEINTKGGTVPANKNMANLASAIGSIATGSSTTITPLSVTENGTYTAPTGTAYSPVTVDVSGGGGIAGFYTGTVTTDSDTGASITINDAFPAGQGCPKAVFLYEMNKAFADADMEKDSTRYPKIFGAIRESATSTGNGNQYTDNYQSFVVYSTRSSNSYSASRYYASVSKQFYNKTSAGTNGYDLCTGHTANGRLYVRSGLYYGIRPDREYRWIILMDEMDA